MSKVMSKFFRIVILSLFFIMAFNAPLFYLKSDFIDDIYSVLITDIVILIPSTILIFYLISHIRFLGSLILALFCVSGAVSNFFVFSFKKSFDAGVLEDILSVDIYLVMEYMNFYIVLPGIIGLFILTWLFEKYIVNIKFDGWKSFIFNILLSSSALVFIYVISTSHPIKSIMREYMPFSIFYNTNKYIKNYKHHSDLAKNKIDLTKKHNFELYRDSDHEDDLVVVFIIGESMRGDFISERHTPRLMARENLIRFTKAKSAATSTKVSIPYMLTSAVPPNADQSLSEKSIISIFKYLGFKTSWIGNQGFFGIWENTFSSIAMEAEYVISRKELESTFTNKIICDECLLPFLSKRLKTAGENQFFVLHFMGSHWHFEDRLPQNYNAKFLPHCAKTSHVTCSHEEIMNSYSETIAYSDEVLDKILSSLEDKNVIVIYASDHGFSLGEDGYFGNAYVGPNTPKEQLDIAMFAWASKKFIENNPEKYEILKSKRDLPVSHDNIFHSLLSCSGVKSDYIDDGLDLCKP